jgi:hypothetical protein
MHDDMSPSPGCTEFLSGRAPWPPVDRIHDASVIVNDEIRADLVQLSYCWLRQDYEPSLGNICRYGTSDGR